MLVVFVEAVFSDSADYEGHMLSDGYLLTLVIQTLVDEKKRARMALDTVQLTRNVNTLTYSSRHKQLMTGGLLLTGKCTL